MIDKKITNTFYGIRYFFYAYYPAPQILTIVKEKEKKWE